MGPLVEEQKTRVQLQLSQEEPPSPVWCSHHQQNKRTSLYQLLWGRSSCNGICTILDTHNANHHSITVLFCRDSKSLCKALISSHPRTLSIHNSINSISSSILIQWIPGHSAIPGNDLSDKAAKEATTIATDTILPISLSNSIQAINETFHDAPPINERVAAVYKHRRVFRDAKQINNRKADVLIARLQSGDHNSIKQYLHRLNASQDPTCPNCCQEEQDLFHWLPDCLVLISVRQRVFACHQGSLEWLATQPGDVVAYARNTPINLHA